MLKNILKLNGVHKITKPQQLSINGGGLTCNHNDNVAYCSTLSYPTCPQHPVSDVVQHFCCHVEWGLDQCL